MKTIGLLGGTGWVSTIDYYRLINTAVNERLGGYHSAKIILKSIDYHEIMTNYGKNHDAVASSLQKELLELKALKPDCVIICCNSLHKYYDLIKGVVNFDVPVMHAAELTAECIIENDYADVLLLATKFTMEDGFFANILKKRNINVVIPNAEECQKMAEIHAELMQGIVFDASKAYFGDIISRYESKIKAVIVGCTEYAAVLEQSNYLLPLINPVDLQVKRAVDFIFNETS